MVAVRFQSRARKAAGQRNDEEEVAKAVRGGNPGKELFTTEDTEDTEFSEEREGISRRSGAEVEELAHAAEFFVAGVQQIFYRLVAENEELPLEGFA